MRSFVLRAIAFAIAVVAIACEQNAALDPTLEMARISLSNKTLDLSLDETQQLTITSNLPPGTAVTWKSLDPSVATVSSTGVVSGRGIGVTHIVAAAKRSTDSATVTVHQTPTKVALDGDSTSVASGRTVQLSFKAYDKTGALITNITNNSGKWSSSNATVAAVSSTGLVQGLALGRAAITFTLNGNSDTEWIRVTAAGIAKVLVSPSPGVSVGIGRWAQLSAIATDSMGNTVTGRVATWQSSDTNIVTVSSTGVVSAKMSGSANVSANIDGQTAQTNVVASPVVVSNVTVQLNSSSITIGQSTQAVATARDASGNVLTGRAVTWSSSDTTVATITPSGLITAIAAGNAAIRATVDGTIGAAALTVAAPTVANVGVVLANSSLNVGQTTQATATASDALGNAITGLAVSWSTSNTAVATVTPSGLVSAVGGGTVSIVATVSGQTGSATLVSMGVTVSSVTVSVPTNSVAAGATEQATATVLNSSGAPVTTTVTWSSSATTIATVSSSGLVTAVSAGSATISAAAGGKTGSVSLSITQPSPTGPTGPTGSTGPNDAELPRVFLTTTMSSTPSPGATIRVASGGSVQAALDQAQPGDRVVVACGARIAEEVHWRKNGTAWTTLMSDCPLPPEGTRMDSVTGKTLAWIESPTVNAALTADLGSGHLRVIGLRLSNSPAMGTVNSTVLLGSAGTDQNQLSLVPTDIILDRIYINVPDTQDDRRCISLQSARSAVIDSWIANCKSAFDAQAITSTNSPGPLKIVNNFLEATGENISFGGGDPHIAGLVPSDIEIRHNYFYKRLSWKTSQWGANEKNLLESKNSSHVLVDGNFFENSWVGGQYGWVFALYSVNQDGTCTWCVTEHWTMRNNLAKNVTSFATVTARLSNFPTALPIKAHHITIRNNMVVGLNPTNITGVGHVFQIWDVSNLTIEHNTGFGTEVGFSFDQAQPTGVLIRNNVVAGCWPVFSGGGQGTAALAYGAAPDAIFAGNVLFGCGATPFVAINPVPGNYYPTDWTAGFALGQTPSDPNTDPSTMVWSPSSPYKGKATDGTDPGADVTAILNATSGTTAGTGGASLALRRRWP